ncbi:MAG: glycosyltransferase family 39 protein [candidate division WS1 bacterium]|nr:glycosyltransferase family 39 protein [candidate division WS1 bacterium]
MPSTRWYVWAILVLFLSLSVWLTVRIPVGCPPDELQHLDQVERFYHGVWADFRQLPPRNEGIQPPLYHALAAGLWRLVGPTVTGARLICTLCGLLMVWLTWKLACELLPHAPPTIPLCAAALVAFVPMNLYMCSVVNNDALANLLVTLGLLLLWQALARGPTPARLLTLGAVCGLALMSKSTALCLLVMVLLALALRPTRWPLKLRWIALALGGLLLVAGWWLVHNQLLYGDPLAIRAIGETTLSYSPWRAPASNWARVVLALRSHYLRDSFWGVFNSMVSEKDFLPWWVYQVCNAGLLFGLLGLVLSRKRLAMGPERRVFLLALLAGLAVLIASYLSFNLVAFSAQGRYFFPFLAVIAIGACRGLSRLLPGRYGQVLPVLFVLFLLLVSFYALPNHMV